MGGESVQATLKDVSVSLGTQLEVSLLNTLNFDGQRVESEKKCSG